MPEFIAFPKMARLSRECVITEKLDGTNSQVHVTEEGEVLAASRNRYITPDDDNFGFAKWVKENEGELAGLGEGRHYGEWWGPGIQRGYGLKEKRFSLFNVSRWAESRPYCCDVVPTLFRGLFTTDVIDRTLAELEQSGSVASPGFMRPEGIIVFHVALNKAFKKTIDKDEEPKSVSKGKAA